MWDAGRRQGGVREAGVCGGWGGHNTKPEITHLALRDELVVRLDARARDDGGLHLLGLEQRLLGWLERLLRTAWGVGRREAWVCYADEGVWGCGGTNRGLKGRRRRAGGRGGVRGNDGWQGRASVWWTGLLLVDAREEEELGGGR